MESRRFLAQICTTSQCWLRAKFTRMMQGPIFQALPFRVRLLIPLQSDFTAFLGFSKISVHFKTNELPGIDFFPIACFPFGSWILYFQNFKKAITFFLRTEKIVVWDFIWISDIEFYATSLIKFQWHLIK